jgi:MoaA/NifB/PqqE/SkfB family radical SAM enzyme
MRVPFFVQATIKKAFPASPRLYRRARSHWHHPRSHYAGASKRFAALVRQISETPYLRIADERFHHGIEHDAEESAKVANAVIEINNTCNIDCLMCKTSLSTRQKGQMTTETLELAVGRTTERGVRVVELHTLGDPLANPRLAEVLALLRRHGVRTGLTTNGLLLHRHVETLIKFVDVCSSLSFSIDGATAPTYERIRAGGNWEQLMANLELAKERLTPNGYRIRSSMVVSRENAHEIGLYIERIRHYVAEPHLDLSFAFVNSLAPDNNYFDATNLFPIHTYSKAPCQMVIGSTPHILVDGRVTVCSRDYDGSLVVGDIRQHSIAEILRGDSMRTLQLAHAAHDVSAYPLCRTCFTVDNRIDRAFNELTAYLLYFFPLEKAGFYQERVDDCIAMFQKGADPKIAMPLFLTPRSGRQLAN